METVVKRQRVEVRGHSDANMTVLVEPVQELWVDLMKAIREVGANVTELNKTVSRIGEKVSEITRMSQVAEVSGREIVGEMRKMVCIQDQMQLALQSINQHAAVWCKPENGLEVTLANIRQEVGGSRVRSMKEQGMKQEMEED